MTITHPDHVGGLTAIPLYAYPRETAGSLRFGLIDGPWPDVRRGHVEAIVLAVALEADVTRRIRERMA